MGTEVPPRPRTGRRTVAAAVGAALLLVLLILGLAFANSVGAGRVAENAAALHWANATSGTSALTRAALTQAVTFSELHHLPDPFEVFEERIATEEDVQFAMGQLHAVTDELRHFLDIGGESIVTADLTRFLSRVDEATEALEGGAVETASRLVGSTVEDSYVALNGSLSQLQGQIQAAIDENTRSAARLNSFALFFVMFAIPGSAVFVYWSIARRQVRELRIRSESELEAERAIGRAKDSFIAGLSHELRTPLTSIYGFAEILAEAEGDHKTQEIVQIIASEAAEMTRMVDDLLAASRLESIGVEIVMVPTGLDEVVESAITPFERAGIKVSREYSGMAVVTDGARLRHVLINLLSNAARHGGDEVGIDISADSESVDIEVWDTGDGVSEEKVTTLFERFVHSGSQPLLTGSVGLGLAVASRLTSLLNGRLTYQRFNGKTYFIVNLPLADDRADEVEEEARPVAAMIKAMSS